VILLAAMMTVSATPAEAINHGRAAIQAGDLPRAILLYRDARIAYPTDAELKSDLSSAREMVDYSSTAMLPRDDMHNLRDRLSESELFAFFAVSLAMAAIGAANFFTSRPRWAGPVMLGSLVLSAITVGTTIALERENRLAREAQFAVVRLPVLLREGNGESYPARIDMPLSVGVELTVLTRRGGWVQVELANGTAGWLPSNVLLQVTE
jgi:hypothetical protein